MADVRELARQLGEAVVIKMLKFLMAMNLSKQILPLKMAILKTLVRIVTLIKA